MSSSKLSDLIGVLKGAQNVMNALIKHQEEVVRYTVTHSSLKHLPQQCLQAAGKKLSNVEPSKIPVSIMMKI